MRLYRALVIALVISSSLAQAADPALPKIPLGRRFLNSCANFFGGVSGQWKKQFAEGHFIPGDHAAYGYDPRTGKTYSYRDGRRVDTPLEDFKGRYVNASELLEPEIAAIMGFST